MSKINGWDISDYSDYLSSPIEKQHAHPANDSGMDEELLNRLISNMNTRGIHRDPVENYRYMVNSLMNAQNHGASSDNLDTLFRSLDPLMRLHMQEAFQPGSQLEFSPEEHDARSLVDALLRKHNS